MNVTMRRRAGVWTPIYEPETSGPISLEGGFRPPNINRWFWPIAPRINTASYETTADWTAREDYIGRTLTNLNLSLTSTTLPGVNGLIGPGFDPAFAMYSNELHAWVKRVFFSVRMREYACFAAPETFPHTNMKAVLINTNVSVTGTQWMCGGVDAGATPTPTVTYTSGIDGRENGRGTNYPAASSVVGYWALAYAPVLWLSLSFAYPDADASLAPCSSLTTYKGSLVLGQFTHENIAVSFDVAMRGDYYTP